MPKTAMPAKMQRNLKNVPFSWHGLRYYDVNWPTELLAGCLCASAVQYGFKHLIKISGGRDSYGLCVDVSGIRVCHSGTIRWFKYAIICAWIILEFETSFARGAILIPSLVVSLLWLLRHEIPQDTALTLYSWNIITMSQQYPNTRQATKQSTSGEVDGEIDIDSWIFAAIKLAFREEMGEISSRLGNIDKTLANLVEVQQRIEFVEESIQYTSDRLDALATEVLPALSNHMSQIAETLAHQTLQIDVYRRKWNIVIHGIEGPAGEEERIIRAKCIQFAW